VQRKFIAIEVVENSEFHSSSLNLVRFFSADRRHHRAKPVRAEAGRGRDR
jgi:hypothetical protein